VLSFTITASSGGVNTPGFAVTDVPDDEPLNQGYLNLTVGNINDPGEFIDFQFSSLVVNLNGATGNGTGTFDGFSGVQLENLNSGTTADVNGVSYSPGVTGSYDVDLAGGGLDSGLLLEDGGAGRFYAGTWSVQVTIPAAPGSIALADFTDDTGDGSAKVSVTGAANTTYKLVEADDLDFSNPDQDPIGLTGATVGTKVGDTVTTDGSGNATVQFNLGNAKSATFLRAEETP